MNSRGIGIVFTGLIVSGASVMAAAAQGMPGAETLPPNAKPGECYARVFEPPVYTTETEQVLIREASNQLEIQAARFDWAEEKILVQEASERLEVVPAQYDWKEEKVLVKPASKKLVEVPAQFEWVEEKILVKPAQTVWKKGRGPVESVDNATGEIMCLVEEPAVYRTVKKRVLKSPATTKEVEIPAEYKTVKKRVMTSPPVTRKVEIPAEFTTVRVLKEISPANVRKLEIPAEYNTVTKTAMVSDGRVEWMRVLCRTNATTELMTRVQRALKRAGHDPGPIDGIIGSRTMRAVTSFQASKGLPEGFLTYETLEALNVSIAS